MIMLERMKKIRIEMITIRANILLYDYCFIIKKKNSSFSFVFYAVHQPLIYKYLCYFFFFFVPYTLLQHTMECSLNGFHSIIMIIIYYISLALQIIILPIPCNFITNSIAEVQERI